MSGAPSGEPPGELPGLSHVRHLARQSALLLSSGAIGFAGAFALAVVLTNKLGASDFGIWVVAWGITQTLAVLGLIGADWILFRHGSHFHSTGDELKLRATIRFALILCTVGLVTLGVLLIILAPTIATTFFHEPALVPLLRLSGIVGPLVGVATTLLYATQAFGTVRDLAIVRNLLQPVVRLGAGTIAVLIRPTPLSAMVGMLAAELILTAVAAVLLSRRISLFGPTEPIDRRMLVRFGLPAWGSKMIETTRGQLFPIMLGSLASFESSGAFAASRRVVAAPNSVIASFNQVYSPQASRLYLGHRRDDLAVLFKSMGKWSFSLAFPLFCLTVAFPKEILSVFGHGFESASSALVVLSFAMLFNFATGPVTTTLIVIGRPRLALLDYLVVLGAEIGLAFALIPRYGLIGAAVARLVGTALNNVVPLAQVWGIMRIHPYRRDYWKPVAAALIATGVALLAVHVLGLAVGPPAAIVAASVTGIVYVGLFIAFGLSAEDRSAVDALVRRARGGRGESRAEEVEPAPDASEP
jgi:O-antigen/teichoic acid export membrane protein